MIIDYHDIMIMTNMMIMTTNRWIHTTPRAALLLLFSLGCCMGGACNRAEPVSRAATKKGGAGPEMAGNPRLKEVMHLVRDPFGTNLPLSDLRAEQIDPRRRRLLALVERENGLAPPTAPTSTIAEMIQCRNTILTNAVIPVSRKGHAFVRSSPAGNGRLEFDFFALPLCPDCARWFTLTLAPLASLPPAQLKDLTVAIYLHPFLRENSLNRLFPTPHALAQDKIGRYWLAVPKVLAANPDAWLKRYVKWYETVRQNPREFQQDPVGTFLSQITDQDADERQRLVDYEGQSRKVLERDAIDALKPVLTAYPSFTTPGLLVNGRPWLCESPYYWPDLARIQDYFESEGDFTPAANIHEKG